MLHHPGYREKFADNLKRELPRIPLAPAIPPSPGTPGEGRSEGSSGFWVFSKAGEKLAKLHLDYEQLKPWDLDLVEAPGVRLVGQVIRVSLETVEIVNSLPAYSSD